MNTLHLEKLSDIFYHVIVKKSDPRYAATMVIQNGPLILGVSRGDNNQWGLPGGKVEPGEAPKNAAIREVKEETGVFIPENKVTLLHTSSEGPFVVYCYLYNGKPPNNLKHSHEGYVKWVTWEDLFKGPFGVANRRIFLELKNGR